MVCIKLTPVEIGKELYIDVNTILKIEDPFENIIGFKDKTIEYSKTKSGIKRRNLPKMDKLIEWKIIGKGDTVFVKNFDNSDAIVIDNKYVNYNGSKMTFNEWCHEVTNWQAISVYEHVCKIGETETLHQLRMEKLEEINSSEQ